METGRELGSAGRGNLGDHVGTGQLRRESEEVGVAESGIEAAEEQAEPANHNDGNRVKLHLGCGAKIVPGFINIDLAESHWEVQPDVCADLRSLPFPDDYADEAHAYHVIEHFYKWEAPDVLTEWRRVLKPGGTLVLELPCFDKIKRMIAAGTEGDVAVLLGLYGEQKSRNPAMVHRWCYTVHGLSTVLQEVGFTQIYMADARFHVPRRDMRFEAVK